MKVNNYSTKWIMIDHKASSLFKLIKDSNFTSTRVGIKAWESLVVHQSFWEENQMRVYHEGFNLYNKDVYVRIGFYLRIKCPGSIPPFLGLGISFHTDTVEDQLSSITCGYFLWNRPGTVAAFGYILVQ
jgi:hypothetical protein